MSDPIRIPLGDLGNSVLDLGFACNKDGDLVVGVLLGCYSIGAISYAEETREYKCRFAIVIQNEIGEKYAEAVARFSTYILGCSGFEDDAFEIIKGLLRERWPNLVQELRQKNVSHVMGWPKEDECSDPVAEDEEI